MKSAELIVVGGGPAGCAAAITAVRRGLEVMLIAAPAQRSPVPESLHPAGLSLLEELGVREIGRLCVGPAFARVWHGDGTPSSLGDEDWRGRHVARERLDTALLDCARASGAAVRDGRAIWNGISGEACSVVVGGNVVHADLVIDATGTSQWLRRGLRLRRRRLSGRLVSERGFARGVPPHGDEPSFHMEQDGWTWMAPLGGDAIAWTRTGLMRTADGCLPGGATRDGPVEARGRAWQAVDPVVGNVHLLAGDAAGHLDPAAGDGIVLALESGRNAAIAAALALRDPLRRQSALDAYANWWQRRFAAKARAMAQIYAVAGLGPLLGDAKNARSGQSARRDFGEAATSAAFTPS